MLGADIQRGILETDHAAHGRIIDDAAKTLFEHYLGLVLHAVENPAHIRLEHQVEACIVLFDQRREHAFGAGIVEGDVQLAIGVHGKFNHGDDVGFAGHVDDDGGRGAAIGSDLGNHVVQLALTAGSSHDLRAALGQDDSGRATNAGTGAGDQRDFAFELTGVGKGHGKLRLCAAQGGMLALWSTGYGA